MNANKKDEIVRAEANPFKVHPANLPANEEMEIDYLEINLN